jgi:hypothetical protein
VPWVVDTRILAAAAAVGPLLIIGLRLKRDAAKVCNCEQTVQGESSYR